MDLPKTAGSPARSSTNNSLNMSRGYGGKREGLATSQRFRR